MQLLLCSLSLLMCANLCGVPWIDGAPIPARRLRDHSEWVDAPGEKRFYARVDMQEGIGLLSGSNQEGLHWVVKQWSRTLDSANPLPEAKEKAIWYGVPAEKVQDIALVTKTVRGLCDILLPAELQEKIKDVPPCTHGSEIQCKQYSADIIVKIKALAQAASTTHQACIIVPEYQYSNWWQSGWYN